MLRRRLRSMLVPLGIYFVASLVAHGALVPNVTVRWNGQRLLERADLENAPVRSLLLLHTQPPAMNVLLASCIHTSRALGVPLKTLVTALITCVGAAAIVLLYWLVAALTRSRWMASGAASVAALDPGFQFFRIWFLAAILVYCLIAAVLALAFKALATGDRRYLAAAVLAVPLLANTKSVFHPIWAMGLVVVLLLLFAHIHSKTALTRGTALTAVAFLVLLFAWPAKNAYVYGSFSFSSWSGFNAARGVPVRSQALEAYLSDGSLSPEMEAGLERFRRRFGESQLHILASPTRGNGQRNRNHYAFVATREELTSKAFSYRTSHPGWWLGNGWVNYLNWTRATFVHPYSEEIRGPWTGSYRQIVHSTRAIFFADVGPLLRWFPDSDPQTHRRWTLYGLVLFPMLLLFAVALVVKDFRHGLSAGSGVAILCLLTLLWHLTVVCLTDGIEGNRMRFGVAPCSLVLAAYVLFGLWERRPDRRPL